ncbi:MAG: hypothetical protein KF754_08750 [Planctomycetes bacterium]|nr:hypothetical protein [Planctomycetota bacterium]
MTASKPADPGNRVLKSLGVAVASALITLTSGIGLGLLIKWGPAVLVGFLAGIVTSAVLFRKRRWVAMPAGVLAPLLLMPLVVLMTPGTRDARRAEAEQMLGSMKNQVRVAYSKSNGSEHIRTLTGAIGKGGCGVYPVELTGKYYIVRDEVQVTDFGVKLVAEPRPPGERDGVGTLTFDIKGGDGEFTWEEPLFSPAWFNKR